MQVLFAKKDKMNCTFDASVVTIGNFDGVHEGHQAVVAYARKLADDNGFPLVVLTFEPHPRAVLFPEKPLHRLTTADEKSARLLAVGADFVHVVPFTLDFAKTSPADFIQTLLVEALHAKHVVAGQDFRFGFKAAGCVETLRQESRFETHVLADVCDEAGERYSSRRLRADG